jgi:CBS domain-containing protein
MILNAVFLILNNSGKTFILQCLQSFEFVISKKMNILEENEKNIGSNSERMRRIQMTKIRDMMTNDIETCSLLDNVYEVALKMKEHNVGSIPIVDGDKIVGMMTDRDIVLRCIAEKHPASSKVEDIMSKHLITVGPDTEAQEAAHIMAEHQVRRLPVVEGDRLIGMISLGDFAIRESLGRQAYVALENISESNFRNKPF